MAVRLAIAGGTVLRVGLGVAVRVGVRVRVDVGGRVGEGTRVSVGVAVGGKVAGTIMNTVGVGTSVGGTGVSLGNGEGVAVAVAVGARVAVTAAGCKATCELDKLEAAMANNMQVTKAITITPSAMNVRLPGLGGRKGSLLIRQRRTLSMFIMPSTKYTMRCADPVNGLRPSTPRSKLGDMIE